MPLSHQGIAVIDGDDATVYFTLLQTDSPSPQDLTGYSGFTLYVKNLAQDPDADAALTIVGVVANSAQGLLQFTLPAASTALLGGSYVYAIRLTDPAGKHHTVASGPFTAKPT